MKQESVSPRAKKLTITYPDGKFKGYWEAAFSNFPIDIAFKIKKVMASLAPIYSLLKKIAGKEPEKPFDERLHELKQYAINKLPPIDDDQLRGDITSLLKCWAIALGNHIFLKYGNEAFTTMGLDHYKAIYNYRIGIDKGRPTKTYDIWAHILSCCAINDSAAYGRLKEIFPFSFPL